MGNELNLFIVATFLFYLGSLTGWVIELFFRRFLSKNNPERKWINPGFCVGPYVPLYGFGLVILCSMTFLQAEVLPHTWVGVIIMIAMMTFAMTLIEYIAGSGLLKLANMRLWDYTKEWGNLQGIICPKFTAIWGAASAGYIFIVHPIIIDEIEWLAGHLTFSFVVGFFFGVFVLDVAYSTNLMSKIKSYAKEEDIVVKVEHLKANINHKIAEEEQKGNFIFALKDGRYLKENLAEAMDNVVNVIEEKKPRKLRKKDKKTAE